MFSIKDKSGFSKIGLTCERVYDKPLHPVKTDQIWRSLSLIRVFSVHIWIITTLWLLIECTVKTLI